MAWCAAPRRSDASREIVFARYGIPIPEGRVAHSPDEALSAAKALGGERWMVKAQVHSGGRGKAGGVRMVEGLDDLAHFANQLLGTTLVTHQTGATGLPVHRLLIEQPMDIARELYLSVLVDRSREQVVFMASASGGMDIEQVAAETPEAIITEAVQAAAGLQPYQCRNLAFALGLEGKQIAALTTLLLNLYRLMQDLDASLLEINPLVVTEAGTLLALDAKMDLDANALYRHAELQELRDTSQEDARELAASEHGLNYITLDGNIACMVNGAGLAMATMDLIKLHGGEPANFLDVGGGATAEKVAEAFKLILSDPKVKAILVNIFGGIVRCDLIAEGIIQAVKEVRMTVPVVVRLEGTNVEQGKRLLADSGLNVLTADGLTDAAKKAVHEVLAA
ncbi:MAG: ADP-forming succinate--CoA ligase subunit beta [Xanthomonadaceae bacterium]|nr:ADP-forming succinate--CoA ligase subunit beta [Xanthomonadaceae bacterium]